MKRGPSRHANLVLSVLGFAVLAFLGWRYLRSDEGVLPVRVATGLTSPSPRPAAPRPAARATAPAAVPESRPELEAGVDLPPRGLLVPVEGVDPRTLQGTFSQSRGGNRSHDALDIMAPRGTPVLAVDDGFVKKLFTSVRGGLTVYQFDLEERYCFYYAHLDGYAPALAEGQLLRRGDLVGYVGSTGNARADAPHLHFAVNRLDPDKRWWGGTPIDPYPLLVTAP